MTVINAEYNKKYEGSPLSIDRDDKWNLLLIRTPAKIRFSAGSASVSSGFVLCSPDKKILCSSDCILAADRLSFVPDPEETALISELGIPVDTPVETADLTNITDAFFAFYAEFMSPSPYRIQKINCFLRVLLYLLAEKYLAPQERGAFNAVKTADSITHRQDKSHYDQFVNVREIFTSSPEKQWTVDDIADEIGLSRSRTQHLYREYFGTAIISDIIASRINRARQLLNNTDMFVMDIAERSGFNSVSYFTGKFRQIVGMTPEQYRNSQRNKNNIQ